jgi:hypothetical protein
MTGGLGTVWVPQVARLQGGVAGEGGRRGGNLCSSNIAASRQSRVTWSSITWMVDVGSSMPIAVMRTMEGSL